jgi:predicted  nucleic acid-binding Zn-ribbon protein
VRWDDSPSPFQGPSHSNMRPLHTRLRLCSNHVNNCLKRGSGVSSLICSWVQIVSLVFSSRAEFDRHTLYFHHSVHIESVESCSRVKMSYTGRPNNDADSDSEEEVQKSQTPRATSLALRGSTTQGAFQTASVTSTLASPPWQNVPPHVSNVVDYSQQYHYYPPAQTQPQLQHANPTTQDTTHINEQIRSQEQIIKQANTNWLKCHESWKSSDSQVQALTTELTTTKHHLGYYQSQNQDLQTQVGNAAKENERLNSRVTTLSSSVTNLTSEVSEMRQGWQTSDDQWRALEGQITQKDQTMSALEGQMTQKDQTISALEGQITQKDQTISTLKDRIARLKTDLRQARAGGDQPISQLGVLLSAVQAELVRANTHEFHRRWVECDADLTEARATIARRDESIAQLNADLAAERQNSQHERQRSAVLEGQLDAERTAHMSTQGLLFAREEELASVKAKLVEQIRKYNNLRDWHYLNN